jgi:hypothetical protein
MPHSFFYSQTNKFIYLLTKNNYYSEEFAEVVLFFSYISSCELPVLGRKIRIWQKKSGLAALLAGTAQHPFLENSVVP